MTRNRATLALAVTAAAVVAVPSTASARPDKGLQDQAMTVSTKSDIRSADGTYSTPESRTKFLKTAKALRVKFVRVLVNWDDSDPDHAATNPFSDEIANIKALAADAPKYGIKKLEIVPAAKSLPENNPKGRHTPPKASSQIDVDAYTKWIASVVSQLKDTPGVTKYYTALNEPNWYRYIPRRGNTTVYRNMHNALSAQVDAIDPRSKVLFGELLPYARPNSKSYPHGQSDNPGTFLRRTLGLKTNWKASSRSKRSNKKYSVQNDGVSLHTYDFKHNPSRRRGSRNAWTQGNLGYAYKYLKLAKKSHRLHARSIYLTEFAYKTHGNDKISTRRASHYMKTAYRIARHYRAKTFLWYQLRDVKHDIWQSGLESTHGTKRVTYTTFHRLK